jgi:hypothetical protein
MPEKTCHTSMSSFHVIYITNMNVYSAHMTGAIDRRNYDWDSQDYCELILYNEHYIHMQLFTIRWYVFNTQQCLLPLTFYHHLSPSCTSTVLSVPVEYSVCVAGCGSPWWWWGEWCSFHTKPSCGCFRHFTLHCYSDTYPPNTYSNPVQWYWGWYIATNRE